ncbi:MAG: glycerophosphodiester phosphodiesterase family protein [bacterium]|nr:glycerophosphodiester phosphodiesterase family protein [bacterium]
MTDAEPVAPQPPAPDRPAEFEPAEPPGPAETEAAARAEQANAPAVTEAAVPAEAEAAARTEAEAAAPPEVTDGAAEPVAATPTTMAPPRPEASTLDGLLALGRPLVIAHAGGDQDHPHSTLYAYAQSAAAGADVLELDVQLTADGALIVQHDDTVDRTTEAGGAVADLTLAEIQALDNAYWFVPGLWGDQTRPVADYVFRGVRGGAVEPPPGFAAEDFRVATFREVAERFPHHVLDVEIKLQRGPDGEVDPRSGIAAAEVLATEIAELGREDSVIVACFNDEVLAGFRQLAPDVATTPATDELVAWWLADETLHPRYRVLQVPFTYAGVEVVQPDLLDRLHRDGLRVWVWLSGTDVVENREFYAELLRRGVDGIIAGRPAEAVAALAEVS